MEFKIVRDKELAKLIFIQGHLTNDENKNNYTVDQFEKAWAKWIGFYVLYDDVHVVAFCGIRKFDNHEARIFDRYFVMQDYRNGSLAHTEWSSTMVETLVNDCIENGYKPFFSIQTAKKRRAIDVAVLKFNFAKAFSLLLADLDTKVPSVEIFLIAGVNVTVPVVEAIVFTKKPFPGAINEVAVVLALL